MLLAQLTSGMLQRRGRCYASKGRTHDVCDIDVVVVDDLLGIWPVAPTSHCPNADVGILDGQQQNVIVAVIKPVPPRNVVEILVDEVA
jgi:hypothetical protein